MAQLHNAVMLPSLLSDVAIWQRAQLVPHTLHASRSCTSMQGEWLHKQLSHSLEALPEGIGEHPAQPRKEVRALQAGCILHKLLLAMIVPGRNTIQARVCIQQLCACLKVGEEVHCKPHVILRVTIPSAASRTLQNNHQQRCWTWQLRTHALCAALQIVHTNALQTNQ